MLEEGNIIKSYKQLYSNASELKAEFYKISEKLLDLRSKFSLSEFKTVQATINFLYGMFKNQLESEDVRDFYSSLSEYLEHTDNNIRFFSKYKRMLQELLEKYDDIHYLNKLRDMYSLLYQYHHDFLFSAIKEKNGSQFRVRYLNLFHFRMYKTLMMTFDEKLTVIAGENSVGKTSLLYALATLLSNALKDFTPSNNNYRHFSDDDISKGESTLQGKIELQFSNGFPVTSFDEMLPPQFKSIKNQVKTLQHNYHNNFNEFVVYYKTERAYLSKANSRSKSNIDHTDPAMAFAKALNGDPLSLIDVVGWLNWLQVSKQEKLLAKMNNIVKYFINVDEVRAKDNNIFARKGEHYFEVSSSLSAGEKSLLSLVVDLARRLNIANPKLKNPTKFGKAIVLIDEIELHLHPRWHREVLRKLTETFSNCQFIVTTHSPQVLGGVEGKQVRYLYREGENILLKSDIRTFGLTSNDILDELMGASERNTKTEKLLKSISTLIDDEKFDEAKKAIEDTRNTQPDDNPALHEIEGYYEMMACDIEED